MTDEEDYRVRGAKEYAAEMARLGRLDDQVTWLTDENARLLAGMAAIRDLHSPFYLYDECGHAHVGDEPNVSEIENVGLVCEDGYEATICHQCCTGGSGYQTLECADNHPGLICWPCATYRLATHYGEES